MTAKLPELVAHRGYPARYPENTLIGIDAALRVGARYLEVDVQLSKDEVPVLFHDRNLKRLCGADGAVHEFSWDQLSEMRASEFERFGYKFTGNRLTTLAQLVEHLTGDYTTVTVFVELKRVSIERFGVTALVRRVLPQLEPIAAQCVLISYSLEALAAARAVGWRRLGVVDDDWRRHRDPAVRALAAEFFFCDIERLPRRRRLALPDTRLAVYESVDAQLAVNLAARGVDLVETFAIGDMLEAMQLYAGAG